MLKNVHRMTLPREVVIGRRVIREAGGICKRLGISGKIVIFSGPTISSKISELVGDSLREHDYVVENVVVKGATQEVVNESIRILGRLKPSLVIGVGGGKVIDIAKLSSSSKNIPFISIPTIASHDGIASTYASIKGTSRPFSECAQSPLAIIADTDIISGSPYRFIASGCGDIIAKYTAVRDWKLAYKLRGEYYGEYAASLALMSAKLVVKNADIIQKRTEEGIRVVLEALISAGIATSIAGSTRPCSGSEHLFSHALDVVAPNPALHGEQCGVGTIMMAYLHGIKWQKIRGFLKKIGAPVTAEELGIEEKYLIKALTIAHKIRPDRYTILGESGISESAAVKIAKVTKVIAN